MRQDTYANFAELNRAEPVFAWRIRQHIRRKSPVLIIAPHGGRIERGTSALAALIAGSSYNLYLFEGRKPRGENQTLHITSHHFDEPQAVALAARCTTVLGVHGCRGIWTIYVGGRDLPLRAKLAAALAETGIDVKANGPKFKAESRLNICNRGSTGRGAQIELTLDLRLSPRWRRRIAKIVRDAIEGHSPERAHVAG